MKAIIQNKYGDVEQLIMAEMPKPKPKDNQLLIEIKATNIASGDMRINKMEVPLILKPIFWLVFGFKGPRSKIRGISASGRIVEMGENVTKYKIGDRVNFINSMTAGCLAEYITLNENSVLAKIPDNVTYEEAAPVAFGAMTAYHFINERTVKRNDDVLIYGASGSVGTYAVSLAKHLGANVTGVSSIENHAMVRSLGADVIDYKTTDFTFENKKYDLVFDTVAKLRSSAVKRVLKENGKYISTKAPTSEKVERLEFMNQLLSEGKIKTVIDTVFNFDDYKSAHKLVYGKHKIGNVVIKIE